MMKYKVNETWLSYEAQGERTTGRDEVLLQTAEDLTANTNWSSTGYTIEKLFTDSDYKLFKQQVHQLLLSLWRTAGLYVSDDFILDQYHTLVTEPNTHLKAIDQTKLISTSLFPLSIAEIEKRISTIFNTPLEVLNPYDGQSVFHFRIIRPKSGDNNPLHRDVWLEDYANCINLYIPIAGSDSHSSLILIPGSHHWPESKVERTRAGALINGVKFNVPAVTAINVPYSVERPSPGENEVLIFTPYLIHGGAVNLNDQTTRISIELRLWKKSN
jgi:hypothetical protein